MGYAHEEDGKTEIQSFFSGKKIFITGVTGFLGSVLLEKLLRSCSDVDTIYILIRSKKGQSVDARIEKMLSSELFCEISPKARNKIIPVEGDVKQPRLGLSQEMEETLAKEVQIIFHVAASTNFASHLRQAMSINFHGTRRLIDLTEKMKNLQVFVHVSTAYCNAIIRGKIKEEVYPSWIDGMELSEVLDKMTDEQIQENESSFLGGHANTYAFTKHLSENMILKRRRSVPIAIIRPSVVLGTWEEPIPGWVENVQNGGVGFIAGAGKGVFRTLLGDSYRTTDIVPCDMVANMTMAAAWDVYSQGENTLKVYHCTSGLENPISLDDYCKLTIQKVIEYPSKEVVWYPAAKCRTNVVRNFIFFFLYHLLPAYILQLRESIVGSNRPIVDYQKKFIRGLKFIHYFTQRDWHFETTNTKNLALKLSPEDSAKFSFDVTKIHWPTYIERCVLGVRHYYHRDSPKSIGRARTLLKILLVLHYAAFAMAYAAVFYLLTLMGFTGWTPIIAAASFMGLLIWYCFQPREIRLSSNYENTPNQ